MSVAAVVKNASKPFWIARYAIAIARWVFPRPGLPARMSERPSVTKSGDRAEPSIVQSQAGLIREIEIVDRLEKGKVRAPREARQPRLLPMRDLFGHEHGEKVAIGPRLTLGALDEIAPDAPGIGEMTAA